MEYKHRPTFLVRFPTHSSSITAASLNLKTRLSRRVHAATRIELTRTRAQKHIRPSRGYHPARIIGVKPSLSLSLSPLDKSTAKDSTWNVNHSSSSTRWGRIEPILINSPSLEDEQTLPLHSTGVVECPVGMSGRRARAVKGTAGINICIDAWMPSSLSGAETQLETETRVKKGRSKGRGEKQEGTSRHRVPRSRDPALEWSYRWVWSGC